MILKHIYRTKHTGGRMTCFSGVLLALIVLMPGMAFGQFGSGNHPVTVSVNVITLLQVSGAAVNLNVTSANVVAGQDQMSVTDASTQLLWGTNSSAQKITAQTSLGTPLYTLNLQSVAPTVGTSAGQITMSTVPADLLLNIGRSSGSSTLRYTAIALASQGTGTDNHTITFTVVAQ